MYVRSDRWILGLCSVCRSVQSQDVLVSHHRGSVPPLQLHHRHVRARRVGMPRAGEGSGARGLSAIFPRLRADVALLCRHRRVEQHCKIGRAAAGFRTARKVVKKLRMHKVCLSTLHIYYFHIYLV
jgi:hypothetical protein